MGKFFRHIIQFPLLTRMDFAEERKSGSVKSILGAKEPVWGGQIKENREDM